MRLALCNDDWKTLPTDSVNLHAKENRTRQPALIWKRSGGYANRLRGNFNRDVGERVGRGSPAVIGRDDAKNGQTFRVIGYLWGHSYSDSGQRCRKRNARLSKRSDASDSSKND